MKVLNPQGSTETPRFLLLGTVLLFDNSRGIFMSHRLANYILGKSQIGEWNSLYLPIDETYLESSQNYKYHSVSAGSRLIFIVKQK